MLRLFERMTEENFRSWDRSTFTELESTHLYISLGLNSTLLSSLLGSVCDYAPTLATAVWGLPDSGGASFFLIGCRPSWYLSGRIEFTLLISKNFMFLMGLLKLYYLAYRAPFLELLTVFAELLGSSVLVDSGRVLSFMLSIFSY